METIRSLAVGVFPLPRPHIRDQNLYTQRNVSFFPTIFPLQENTYETSSLIMQKPTQHSNVRRGKFKQRRGTLLPGRSVPGYEPLLTELGIHHALENCAQYSHEFIGMFQ